MPRFIVLCFTVLRRYCVLYKLKVCGSPVLSEPTGAVCPTVCSFPLFVSHFGKSRNSSNFFIIIILVVVICNQWSLMLLLLTVLANLFNKYVCFDCSTGWPFPHLSPSLWASLFPEIQNIEIRPINKLTMASECSSERKSHTPLCFK